MPEVLSQFEAQLARMATESVPEAELSQRKIALSGNYSRSLERNAGLANAVEGLVAFDQPLAPLNRYAALAQAVTPAQVRSFATRHLDVAQASLVIVGDGRRFLPALRKRYPQLEVIPIADLDLNRAGLRKH